MKPDCLPGVVACVVASDNLTDSERLLYFEGEESKDKEPQLTATESCLTVQTALEHCGIMVIPVINPTMVLFMAILNVLTKRGLPKSCELFWFVFTGHGRRNNFFIHKQPMSFEKLIEKVSRIQVKYTIFFFECCQVEGQLIKVADIDKQHMALYSAPPKRLSFHYKGVGVLMSCIANMLVDSYKKSFNCFQQELRSFYLEKVTEVLKILPEEQDEFKDKILPVNTCTMYDDINLHVIRHNASKFSFGRCMSTQANVQILVQKLP